MLKLTDQIFDFCPKCGQKLSEKKEDHHFVRFCTKHGNFYPHVAVASCAVIIKDNKVLLVRRAREPFIGKWTFPAGYVEYGEHPAETVVREVMEEIGQKVTSTKIIDVLQGTDDFRAPGQFVFFYLTTIKETPFKLDLSENTEIAWFELSKLPPIAFRSHQEILNRLTPPSGSELGD